MLFQAYRIHETVNGPSFYSLMLWTYHMRDYPDGWAEPVMVDLDSEYWVGSNQTFGKLIFQNHGTYGLTLEAAIQLGVAKIISSAN